MGLELFISYYACLCQAMGWYMSVRVLDEYIMNPCHFLLMFSN